MNRNKREDKKSIQIWFVFFLVVIALFEFSLFLKQNSNLGITGFIVGNFNSSVFSLSIVPTILFVSVFVLIVMIVRLIDKNKLNEE